MLKVGNLCKMFERVTEDYTRVVVMRNGNFLCDCKYNALREDDPWILDEEVEAFFFNEKSTQLLVWAR